MTDGEQNELSTYQELESHAQAAGVFKADINGRNRLAFLNRTRTPNGANWSLSWENMTSPKAYQRKNVGQLQARFESDVQIFQPIIEPLRPVPLDDRNPDAVYLVDKQRRALPVSQQDTLSAIAQAKPLPNLRDSDESWVTVIPDINETGQSYVTLFTPQGEVSGEAMFRAFSRNALEQLIIGDADSSEPTQKKNFLGLAQQVRTGNFLSAYADIGKNAVQGLVKDVPSTKEAILDWLNTADLATLQKLAAKMAGVKVNKPDQTNSEKTLDKPDKTDLDTGETNPDRRINRKAVAIASALGIGVGVLGANFLNQAFPGIDPNLLAEPAQYFNIFTATGRDLIAHSKIPWEQIMHQDQVNFAHEYVNRHGYNILNYLFYSHPKEAHAAIAAAGGTIGGLTGISNPFQRAVEKVGHKLSSNKVRTPDQLSSANLTDQNRDIDRQYKLERHLRFRAQLTKATKT